MDSRLSCRKLWESRDSNHIVKFYVAFEYCPSTLHQFIVGQMTLEKLVDIMRGLIDGVKELHGKEICHGKLNPWNILLTNSCIPKISGFSNFKDLTPELKGRDLRALEKLIIYCYSSSSHDVLSERDYELEVMELRQMASWAYEPKDIASRFQENSLPSLAEVYNHPWIWENEKRVEFIKDASEYLEAYREHHDNCLKPIRSRIYENGDWSLKIPPNIVARMKSYGEYDYDKPRELLRFIRNLLTHLPDVLVSKEITYADHKFLGTDKFAVEKAFRKLFPALLIRVYAFLRDVPRKSRASLNWYFHS